ncbi:MAG: ABC transporter ATP-binding protein [Bacteroidales bacterium]|nr:ABC transporter ATP-binding protein [Bacteroidales bacterium]
MNILETQDIVKQYAEHVALKNVSISVPENSIYGLLGPNGAGKTTLIRIINQIIAPDEGRILFNGQPMTRKQIGLIGYLPEERGLYKKMKVGEQAIYLSQLKGVPKQDALKRLKYWFEKFEIESWWNKKVEELSKGMQQKIQFIVTIIHEPKFLIFDEPFSGFDPINTDIIRKEILFLKEKGATIIFSTHNMASVEELCDNIALINKSKKILEGNVSEIIKAYTKNEFLVGLSHFQSSLNDILPSALNPTIIKQENGKADVLFKLPKDLNSNDLLNILIPQAHICYFNEQLPNMNDIFISNVKSQIDFSHE